MNVSEMMTTDVISLNEDDNLDFASMEMSVAGIRHLPIVRQGRLVGLVTHRDILGAMCSGFADVGGQEQSELFRGVKVDSIMSREVKTVEPSCDVTEAARILLESKYGCLPVVSDGYRLVGIVTEADFVELAVKLLDTHGRASGDQIGLVAHENEIRLVRGNDEEDW